MNRAMFCWLICWLYAETCIKRDYTLCASDEDFMFCVKNIRSLVPTETGMESKERPKSKDVLLSKTGISRSPGKSSRKAC